MKLWGGRFSKETDDLVNKLNQSISFDKRMYGEDIAGSMAHAAMLADQGIISFEDYKAIYKGLEGILNDIQAGKIEFSEEDEDIHMNIERFLTERIGEPGRRLHTARSRNDQVAVDFRLYVKETIPEIVQMLTELLETLADKADENIETVMPGFTHLQHAQPITLAHHLMAYAQMIKRDITRLADCRERMDECPLGAGALAGTTYPIDREATAEALGFAKPTDNSLDSVSDRDFAIEFLSCASIIMMHLSRFAEEIILWCSTEFGFIELDDAYATGSSIMPQKKNPDVAELVRGKTGRVYGDLITLLTVMKGIPLAYNKDMQEDKEPVFDAVDTLENVIPVFAAMIRTMSVRKDRMQEAANEGFLNATDVADYLVKKGMPFRDAHAVSGRLVAKCAAEGKKLDELSLSEYKSESELFDQDVYGAIELMSCVNGRKSIGGPASEEVKRQINAIRDFISGGEL